MTRDDKIALLKQLIWDVEGASVLDETLDSYTDDELDRDIEFYDYVMDK